MSETMPTFEDFIELVKKHYLEMNAVCGEENSMRYFNSEEAQCHIMQEYECAVEDYNNGELGSEAFRNGVVARVSYCLYMMYE